MPSTRLNLKKVPSAPKLSMVNLKTDNGADLVALAFGTDSVHIVSADGSLKNFGGLTVVGPDVTTTALDWGKLAQEAWEVAKRVDAFLGGGGGSGGGSSVCTTTTNITVDGKGGSTMTTTTTCRTST
jgi:hypothetical protein